MYRRVMSYPVGSIAYVLGKLPDGSVAQTCAGDIIGRQWTWRVVLSDERVSLAHGMVMFWDGTFPLVDASRRRSRRRLLGP